MEAAVVSEGRAVRSVIKAAVGGEAAERVAREQRALADSEERLGSTAAAVRAEAEAAVEGVRIEAARLVAEESAAREAASKRAEGALAEQVSLFLNSFFFCKIFLMNKIPIFQFSKLFFRTYYY